MLLTKKSRIDAPDEPDPIDLVQKAIAADLDTSIFTERQWNVAKNSIDWCTNHEFLAFDMQLWPRQIQMLALFFEDVCYFCSDVPYVHNVPVDDSLQNLYDRMTLLEHGVCPRCHRNRLEMLSEWHKDPRYDQYHNWDPSKRQDVRPVPPNEFIGIWGQRSSKSSSVASFFWTYILHRYLALPSLTNYFRMPSNSMLEMVAVAPIKEQINTNMWTPFKHAFDTSPWFREYVGFLNTEEKRLGLPMYMRQQTYVGFPSKRLILTMRAANSSTLRGSSRLAGTLDELGHFNLSPEGKKLAGIRDGAEVFTSIRRSLRTVRSAAEYRRTKFGDYDAIDGYMFCISSPSSIGDAIEQRAALAPKLPRVFFRRYATWEVNPWLLETTLREEEGAEEVKFNRDYGAIPPRAASPFIEPSPFLKQLVDKEYTKRPLITYEIRTAQDKDLGITLLRPVLTRKTPDKTMPRVLTVDNGEKKNSFAICIGSYYPEHDGVLLEEFIEVAPYEDHRVDLQWCYDELVVPLVRLLSIPMVIYDRWESSYAIRDLRTNYNIDAIQYSLKWKDFEAFKENLRASRVWFPIPEVDPDDLLLTNNLVERARHPRAHFQLQLTTVNQFGRKVTKPDNGNDDLFRCAVLAQWAIMNNKEKFRRGTRTRSGGPKRSNVFSTAGRGNHAGASSSRGPARRNGVGGQRRHIRY